MPKRFPVSDLINYNKMMECYADLVIKLGDSYLSKVLITEFTIQMSWMGFIVGLTYGFVDLAVSPASKILIDGFNPIIDLLFGKESS